MSCNKKKTAIFNKITIIKIGFISFNTTLNRNNIGNLWLIYGTKNNPYAQFRAGGK